MRHRHPRCAAPIEAGSGITCTASAFSSNVATTLSIKPPGILAGCKDAAGYPLTVNAASVTPRTGVTLSVDPNGGFNASVAAAGTYAFTFKAQNSQGTVSATAATVNADLPGGDRSCRERCGRQGQDNRRHRLSLDH